MWSVNVCDYFAGEIWNSHSLHQRLDQTLEAAFSHHSSGCHQVKVSVINEPYSHTKLHTKMNKC